MKNSGDDLSPEVRAEDILLGSLGFGEDARILSVERTAEGYRGVGKWPDGEQFDFESDDDLDELQLWALEFILTARG
jgi:hypothetical protein